MFLCQFALLKPPRFKNCILKGLAFSIAKQQGNSKGDCPAGDAASETILGIALDSTHFEAIQVDLKGLGDLQGTFDRCFMQAVAPV